ncbi:hypothetical protein DRP04_07950 [Archaeoglobales archaeon]|nr:MAG: hypothetical protein DRP04_07950 [Archaeoglobales archaeon]
MSRIRVLSKGFAVRDLANRKISIREPLSVIKVGKVVSLVNERFELRLSRQDDGKVVYAFYYRREVLAKGIVVWMPRIPFIKRLLES